MSNITDDISNKVPEHSVKAVENSAKAVLTATKASEKTLKTTVKGICLLIKGGAFSAKGIMKAVKAVLFKKTGNIEFSKRNVSISDLSKSGYVRKIDESITRDVMKDFDEVCKKYKIKYSAMKDMQNADQPVYYVFFESNNTEIVLAAMKEAYKNYMKHQKNKEADKNYEKKESVISKLAFFRNRVTSELKGREAIEKNKMQTEPQR